MLTIANVRSIMTSLGEWLVFCGKGVIERYDLTDTSARSVVANAWGQYHVAVAARACTSSTNFRKRAASTRLDIRGGWAPDRIISDQRYRKRLLNRVEKRSPVRKLSTLSAVTAATSSAAGYAINRGT